MRAQREMIEGPEAWDRFKSAVKAVIKVPKNALSPTPFGKRTARNEKGADVKQVRAALCAVFGVCALYSIVEMVKDVMSGRSYLNGLVNVLHRANRRASFVATEDREISLAFMLSALLVTGGQWSAL